MKRIKRLKTKQRLLIVNIAAAASIALVVTLIFVCSQSQTQSQAIEPEKEMPLKITNVQLQHVRSQAAIDAKIAEIEQLLQGYNQQLSVGFYDLTTNDTYTYNADAEYYEASLVKVVAAMYAYEKMDLTDNIRNLVRRSISVSDNNAYQNLVQIIGPKNLKQYGASIGLTDFLQTADLYYGNTTIADQLTTFKHLWQLVNTHEQGEELKNDFIGSNSCYLSAPEGTDIMCKYGQYDQYFHNAGIVLADKPYIVVILTEANGRNYAEMIRTISQQLYELHTLL